MLTRPLSSSLSAISAIAVTLGAMVLPGVAPGALPIAAADVGCPAADPPTANAGTYGLSTAAHLQWVKENSGSWGDSFLLTSNIDMTGCTWDAGIGNRATPFTGSFDGDDSAITGITVKVATTPVDVEDGVAGLFGQLGSGAIVRDLTVTGSVSADIGALAPAEPFAYAGGIAGRAFGASLSNVHFAGSVTSQAEANHAYAGGIVGTASASTITGASASAAVNSQSSTRPMGGGIAGETGYTTIVESWAVGSVFVDGRDESRAGGIAGAATGGSITRSFSMARVTAAPASEPSAGGIAGVAKTDIVDSYSRSSVWGSRFTGGLVGWLYQDDAQYAYRIEKSYYSGSIGMSTPTPPIGGIGGRTNTVSGAPALLPDTFWDTTTTGTTVPIGESDTGVLNPPATGAAGETTANMMMIGTYDDSNWDIGTGYDVAYTWGICSGYNDGYPFLTSLFDADPCGGSPAASITAVTPSQQTFSGEAGTNVATSAFTTAGFVGQPVFTVSPPLPPGLTLDPLTGSVSGVLGLSQKATTYVITATSGIPYQTATSTLQQTSGTMAPGQLSALSPNEDVNGLFQSVATSPDGNSLTVTYGNFYNADGNPDARLTAYLADSSGALIGNGVNILPAGVSVGAYAQPSVAHNPSTGGWLTCYARMLPSQKVQPTCQYLNADGTPQGSAFAVVPQSSPDGGSNQTAIAYSPETQSFLVAATLKNAGPYAQFVDAATGAGVIGPTINLRTTLGVTFSTEGGVDVAYSPVSETYGFVTRAKVSGSTEQPAPWLFHLDATGAPTAVPERIIDDTTVPLTSGSVAYNATDEAFMVVAWEQADSWPLRAQRFSAVDGTQVGVAATTEVPADTQYWSYRPIIAAHAEASEYVVTAPMQLQGDANNMYYAYRLDGDGAAVGSEELIAGATGIAAGFRPRLAFNIATCEYTTSYQVNDPSWGWQLFSGAISTTYPCAASTPPSPPLNASATAGNAKATVTWQLPNSAGSSAITSYEVIATPGGATCSATAPALTCEVTGLSNGTSYTFEVRAQNNSGWGPYSQPSSAVTPSGGSGPGPDPVPTPSTPPSSPLNVTANAGDATATVTWQAPASPGSSAITAYQVTSAPGGGTCLASAPALTCEVTGLTNGTTYTFTVRARNETGWSEASAPSNAVTPTAPVDPAIVITGFRANDGKGRRIVVDGSTTGMSGMSVTPHFRFPGRSDYRAGVLSLPIDDKGAFRWSRSTSRKIFVYFDGGGVRSNTIVIAAR